MNRGKKARKNLTLFEHYLFEEIGIEFKACLFFFCILVFYCTNQLCNGSKVALILHMTEMISLTYIMGYVQVYLLDGFDEADKLDVKGLVYMILCTIVYTACSYFGNWFEKDPVLTIGFFTYMFLAYLCAFFLYKFRRKMDEKMLNNELRQFQARKKEEQA